MNEGYFEWLLNKAGVSDDEDGFSYLCSILHEVIFHPTLEMDENRWEDGIRYRYEFASEKEGFGTDRANWVTNYLDDSIGGCTMLELILSLAEKMHFEMLDSQYDAGVGKWFEELLSNLGLDMYTNRELMENEAAYFEIDDILNKLIYRNYRYNGEGGLFPLRGPKEDQRDVEMLIQMNNYIIENYDILS